MGTCALPSPGGPITTSAATAGATSPTPKTAAISSTPTASCSRGPGRGWSYTCRAGTRTIRRDHRTITSRPTSTLPGSESRCWHDAKTRRNTKKGALRERIDRSPPVRGKAMPWFRDERSSLQEDRSGNQGGCPSTDSRPQPTAVEMERPTRRNDGGQVAPAILSSRPGQRLASRRATSTKDPERRASGDHGALPPHLPRTCTTRRNSTLLRGHGQVRV